MDLYELVKVTRAKYRGHTQCANRPFCVTVMRILSAKLTVVAVVSVSLIATVAVFVRAGYGVGVTT